MVNEHLSLDEYCCASSWCKRSAAIVREEKQNDHLSMQDEAEHVITLKYGGITVPRLL